MAIQAQQSAPSHPRKEVVTRTPRSIIFFSLSLSPTRLCRAPPHYHCSHPKNAEARLGGFRFDSASQSGAQALRQHAARVGRRNHAVVPQAGRGVDGVALALDARLQLWVDGLAHRFHHGAELRRAHDADFGRWPHPEETWGIGATTENREKRNEVLAFFFCVLF